MTTRSILFCEPGFQVECPIRWDALQITDDAAVRMCSTCQRNVHFCETLDQAISEAAAGHCVAVPSSMRDKPVRIGELMLSDDRKELYRVRSLGQRPSASLIARASNTPLIDVLKLRIDPDVTAKLPATLAFEQQMIAFFEDERSVFIAMSNPENIFGIEQSKEIYQKNVKVSVAGTEDIAFKLRELYPTYVP